MGAHSRHMHAGRRQRTKSRAPLGRNDITVDKAFCAEEGWSTWNEGGVDWSGMFTPLVDGLLAVFGVGCKGGFPQDVSDTESDSSRDDDTSNDNSPSPPALKSCLKTAGGGGGSRYSARRHVDFRNSVRCALIQTKKELYPTAFARAAHFYPPQDTHRWRVMWTVHKLLVPNSGKGTPHCAETCYACHNFPELVEVAEG